MLYPILQELEEGDYVSGEWEQGSGSTNKRTKRYYTISPSGIEKLGEILNDQRGRLESSLMFLKNAMFQLYEVDILVNPCKAVNYTAATKKKDDE